jgi:hypothetical protein
LFSGALGGVFYDLRFGGEMGEIHHSSPPLLAEFQVLREDRRRDIEARTSKE